MKIHGSLLYEVFGAFLKMDKSSWYFSIEIYTLIYFLALMEFLSPSVHGIRLFIHSYFINLYYGFTCAFYFIMLCYESVCLLPSRYIIISFTSLFFACRIMTLFVHFISSLVLWALSVSFLFCLVLWAWAIYKQCVRSVVTGHMFTV